MSPAAFFGYQRIDQIDAFNATVTESLDVTQMSLDTKLSTDYHRLAWDWGPRRR